MVNAIFPKLHMKIALRETQKTLKMQLEFFFEFVERYETEAERFFTS